MSFFKKRKQLLATLRQFFWPLFGPLLLFFKLKAANSGQKQSTTAISGKKAFKKQQKSGQELQTAAKEVAKSNCEQQKVAKSSQLQLKMARSNQKQQNWAKAAKSKQKGGQRDLTGSGTVGACLRGFLEFGRGGA